MNTGWHCIFICVQKLVTGNQIWIKSFAVDQATLLSTNSQSCINIWGQIQESEMGESEMEGIEVENWEIEDSIWERVRWEKMIQRG